MFLPYSMSDGSLRNKNNKKIKTRLMVKHQSLILSWMLNRAVGYNMILRNVCEGMDMREGGGGGGGSRKKFLFSK